LTPPAPLSPPGDGVAATGVAAAPRNAHHNALIVDVEGARDIGPSEAAGLIRECLAITHKRYDDALARALTDLESPPAPEGVRPAGESVAEKLATAVRHQRSKFVPRFRSEFDRLFQIRREGTPLVRDQRGPREITLALVEVGEHTGQVALKTAVSAMEAATRGASFAFDIRTRMMMREELPAGSYDNPWGAALLCDAIGNTCRALWPDDGLWRPIMVHLVRALTPVLAALQAELDSLLQDRDVLPVLRTRTRKRGRAGPDDGDAPGDLFSKVARMYHENPHAGGEAPAAGTSGAPGGFAQAHAWAYAAAAQAAQRAAPGHAPAPPAAHDAHADPLDFGNAAAWHLQQHPAGIGGITGFPSAATPVPAAAYPGARVLERAIELLHSATGERVPRGMPAFDPAMLDSGTSNVLPVIDAAIAASGAPPLPRAIVEVVSAALDEIFENPYLPTEVKVIFGRLQIPLLKAALKDPEAIASPRHPARRFFDSLAAAAVGVRPDVPSDALFIALANHLVDVVRDGADAGEGPFARAREELDTFLDAERAAYNQKLTQALPALIALDENAEARRRAYTALSLRVGRRKLAPEIRDFIDHECVDRLSEAFQDGDPDGPAAKDTIQLVDDLIWSIAPDRVPGARKQLLLLIPRLVRRIAEMWPPDESTRIRRKVFLARLYELHVEAINTVVDLPPPDAEGDLAPARMESVQPPAEPEPAASRADDVDATEPLIRGDWCAFAKEDDGPPLLARFAWQAPHGTQLLFSYRDGAIALIHTPESLAHAFRDGRAKPAVEAVPVFERAMEKLLDRQAQ
jgi:hypothetical protein